MSDTSNIANLLNLNVTGSTLSASSPMFGEIHIVSLPPDLQKLDETQILEGKILGVKKDGLVLIDTEFGNVTVNTSAPASLQNKKEIEVRLEAGSPPTKAILRPAAHDKDIKQAERFDTKPVQTTLTPEVRALKSSILSARQLLSGMPLQLALFGSEETVAQPFMKQSDFAVKISQGNAVMPSAPENVGSVIVPTPEDSSGTSYTRDPLPRDNPITGEPIQFSLIPTRQGPTDPPVRTPQQVKVETTLPAQRNAPTLPFRAIAVQVLGTSSETRISIDKPSQPPTVASAPESQSKSESSTPTLTIANHAEIKVRNIFPPQVHFADQKNLESHREIQNIHNPYFTNTLSKTGEDRDVHSNIILGSQAGRANAVVEGFTQTRNIPVLRMISPQSISERLYALDVPVQDLPMGCQLECEIDLFSTNNKTSSPLSVDPDKPMQAASASHFLTHGNWPVIEEIQKSLAQVSPQTAQAFNAALPSASVPAQLGASVLFFVAALRSGDVQSWLGEKAVDALKRSGKSSLLGRIGNEFSGLSQVNKERVSGEWRAISIPLVWQNDTQKMVIYTRNEDADDPDDSLANKGRKTRFVVDLSLSNIGPLQLDGLFSGSPGEVPGETSGRLDLVLRTEQGFSQAMKQQMRSAYKKALDETRITGELSFQDHTLDWVRVTPGETAEFSENA